jgi:hypothetical protein
MKTPLQENRTLSRFIASMKDRVASIKRRMSEVPQQVAVGPPLDEIFVSTYWGHSLT